MFDPKKLLDDLLGSKIPGTESTVRDKAGQATQLAKDNPLATGALRSSCTITVSPFGKIHFWAVLGGNAIRADGSGGAAFKLTMGNNRAAVRKLATGMGYIVGTFDY